MGRKKKKGFFSKLFVFGFASGLVVVGIFLIWISTFRIPDLNSFEERKISQSTKIYDRTGEILLYDLHKNIKRSVVPFDEISRNVKNATVAIEDTAFYEHNGIKPSAFLRAIIANLGNLEFSQGGSTITQQVVKNSILTSEKKISRKLKEWVLALKLETEFSKDEILGLYLNEVPYGGSIYGIEEASNSFFGKSALDLTIAESAYLAALPQAPTFYSPYGNNKDRLEMRKDLVLKRMVEEGFITEDEFKLAKEEVVDFHPRADVGIRAPHFVFFVIEQLERKYGKRALEERGFRVTTSLDANLQEMAEETLFKFANENEEKFNAENAGLIAIDPKTGEILTMVGSRDYFDTTIDGNFNITIAHRQPGSAFKPFVYATAFNKGYTPETVVFDLETEFSSTCGPQGKPRVGVDEDECYMPSNYDDVFRGPVTLRNALAQSINIPAIKTLYLSGLQDSLDTAKRLGINSLTDIGRYGLTLVLGGGEVSLLDITSAYSVFANEGVRNPYVSILKIEDGDGDVIQEFKPDPVRVLPENTALLISDILSDEEARAPAFGRGSYLYFPGRDVAVKTGTTNDYRDAWIIGYSPQIAVGTWAGNNDNSPMEKKVAGFIVAPMWNDFMRKALDEYPKESFRGPKQEDNSDISPILRGLWQGGESFYVDKISGKLATEYTPLELREEKVISSVHNILYWINKKDPLKKQPKNPEDDSQFESWEYSVRKWVKKENINEGGSIPTEYDDVHVPERFPGVSILNPQSGGEYDINNSITISINQTKGSPLSKVDFFAGNSFLGSKKSAPFTFTFVPNGAGLSRGSVTLKVVAYDGVLNKGTASVSVNLR